MGTVQNVIGAVPVRYKRDPPEGPKALPVLTTLGIGQTVFAQLLNLSDWQMSQVVSAIIDNTQSDVDVLVTMGATNMVVTVPARAGTIVPAFSNGPSFNILLVAKETPAQVENIVITLLNFEKQPSTWSYSPIQVAGNLNANITNASIAVTGSVNANITGGSVTITSGTINANITNATLTTINNIVNTTHNSGLLYSGVVGFVGNNTIELAAGGSSGFFYLDSLDLAIEVGVATGAGIWGFTLVIGSWTGAAIDTAVHTCHPQANFAAGGGAGSVPGIGLNGPSYRTWPQGFKVPAGAGNQLVIQLSAAGNLSSTNIRVNLSGYAP